LNKEFKDWAGFFVVDGLVKEGEITPSFRQAKLNNSFEKGGEKMKEVLKKMGVAGVGSVLLAGVAFAAPSLGNHDTGRNSENNVKWESEHEVKVETENDADIFNGVLAGLNTGFNEAEDNEDGDVSISTGNASASVDIENVANHTEVSVATPANNWSDMEAGNWNTGRNSENNVTVEHKKEVSVETNNDAHVTNLVGISANTGFNEASDNEDGNVSITTGNASANVSISNNLNRTSVTVK
jgi:hypothetical protein